MCYSNVHVCLNLAVDSDFREASVAVTASGDSQAKVFCLQRPDR